MMTSNFLSRFRSAPTEPVAVSIYETIRQHDEDSDGSDLEERAGLGLGRSIFHGRQQHFDSQPTDPGSSPERNRAALNELGRSGTSETTPWPQDQERGDGDETDDEVPASLVLGARTQMSRHAGTHAASAQNMHRTQTQSQSQSQWQRARVAQNLHPSAPSPRPQDTGRHSSFVRFPSVDPKEKAMWRWINVDNLDNFLWNVYHYYLNHGFWSILLKRFLSLATSAFMIGFSLFVTQCIKWSSIKNSTSLSAVVVERCTRNMGFLPNAALWLTTFIWIWLAFRYAVLDLVRLRQMHDFYHYLLGVSELEIQSISWQEVVSRFMALRDSNPNIATSTNAKHRKIGGKFNKQRLDAHDIANRLMRRDNYMVAMVNKDILDMTLPIPGLRNRQLFTRTLEWNLSLSIMSFVFNDEGQIRQIFLKDTHRRALSDELKKRFVFFGTLNLFIAPFLLVYFIIQNFFQYFNEYQKNPGQIGARQYNTLARWKFREFNELWHLFERRLNMSHPFATRYINQFPKDKTIQIAHFVTFVSGAIVSVLGLATILDQENFFKFEITPGRTAIFYLGVFGSIWAVARGMLPEENMVYDPTYSMEEVIDFTHYRPTHWEGRLHTVEVKSEFERLYQMQIFTFAEELLSMIFTPFVLWFSLPKCSDQIIDFFREFTVHVDGVGYVCSFAEFNFKKPGNMPTSDGKHKATTSGLRDEYFATKDQKLEQSYWGFMNDYGRNPKTSVQFPYRESSANLNRRKFYPPPPFPGMPSRSVHQTDGDQGQTSHLVRRSNAFSPARLPRHTSHNSQSPFQSLLLDPHHQPPASGQGTSSSHGIRTRSQPLASSGRKAKRGTRTMALQGQDSVIVETPDHEQEDVDNDAPPADLLNVPRITGVIHTNDVSIGQPTQLTAASSTFPSKSKDEVKESWQEAEDLDNLDPDEDATTEDELHGGNGGVLGLIKQFQRVQGEGVAGGMGFGGPAT